MGGKSLPIVRLSITAESLHLGSKTKQKRLQVVHAQILKGTQISDNAPCRQRDRNDTQLTFTHTVLVKMKTKQAWNSGRCFVCISAWVWAWLCLSMHSCVHRKLSLSNRPHEPCCCHWRGSIIQLCTWHGTLSYPAENKTGPLKPPRPIVLSDKWEAGVHIGGIYNITTFPFQKCTFKTSRKTILFLLFHTILFSFYSLCLALYVYPFSCFSLLWNTRPCAGLQSLQIPARAPTAATSPAWGSLPGALCFGCFLGDLETWGRQTGGVNTNLILLGGFKRWEYRREWRKP